MYYLAQLFYTILPVIFAGVANMIFVKISILDSIKTPMDAGFVLSDGKRLFGDNKTWKGFIGMIVFTMFFTWLIGLIAKVFPVTDALLLFSVTTVNFALLGLVMGLGYVVAELPNSFIKRRIDIQPGTNISGWKGGLFIFIDQADSVAGILIALMFFYPLQFVDYISLFFFATALHLLINYLLFLVDLKKQPT